MSLLQEQIELTEVGDCCEKWTAVVRLFAEKRQGRETIQEADYRTIHTDLLEACQAAISTLKLPRQQQATLQELRTLAQPWMNLESLQNASPTITLDLLQQGEAFLERLGRKRRPPRSSLPLVFLLIFGFGFLATLVVTLANDLSFTALAAAQFSQVMHAVLGGVRYLRELPLVWPIGTVIFVLLVGLAWLVFRSPRRY